MGKNQRPSLLGERTELNQAEETKSVPGKTKIEWTDKSWNAVTGCTKVSAGCKYCYAETLATRFKNSRTTDTYRDGFNVVKYHPDRISEPLRWRHPSMVFVASMSDLFHADVPDDAIRAHFDVMTKTPQHTYQILTKRPERMLEIERRGVISSWPSNVWMGVSVEDARASGRIELLRESGARLKWISAEPLLGPLNALDLSDIAWMVIGGESGVKSRPLDLAWVRDLVVQCRAASTAVFVKQLGRVSKGFDDRDQSIGFEAKEKSGSPAVWPTDLRIREYPDGTEDDSTSTWPARVKLPDLDQVRGWLRHAYESNGLDPARADSTTVNFTDRFSATLGDAHNKTETIRLALEAWQEIGPAKRKNLVIHEACHLVAMEQHGLAIAPHGKEWKMAMRGAGETDLSAKYKG